MTWIWSDGHGSPTLWGSGRRQCDHHVDAADGLRVLFGLSIDRELFIRTRIREIYDTTGALHRRTCSRRPRHSLPCCLTRVLQ